MNKPLPLLPTDLHPTIRMVPPEKMKNDIKNRLERHPSDTSCPSMMTDSFSSTSDAGLEDDCSDYTPYDGWDSYWSSASRPPSCYLDIAIQPLPRSQQLYENRNLAASDLSKLNITSPTTNVYMSDINHSSPNLSAPRKRSQTLIPLPTQPLQAHISCSVEQGKPVARPSRPRANTTPSQHNHKGQPAFPLSPCPDLNSYNISTQSSPIYMRYPPSTPIFAPSLSALPPLELESETSYFEDDEEEGPRIKLAKVFRRRGSSNVTVEESLEKDSFSGRPKRKFRKRVSDANQVLKGVFGIKK